MIEVLKLEMSLALHDALTLVEEMQCKIDDISCVALDAMLSEDHGTTIIHIADAMMVERSKREG